MLLLFICPLCFAKTIKKRENSDAFWSENFPLIPFLDIVFHKRRHSRRAFSQDYWHRSTDEAAQARFSDKKTAKKSASKC